MNDSETKTTEEIFQEWAIQRRLVKNYKLGKTRWVRADTHISIEDVNKRIKDYVNSYDDWDIVEKTFELVTLTKCLVREEKQ